MSNLLFLFVDIKYLIVCAIQLNNSHINHKVTVIKVCAKTKISVYVLTNYFHRSLQLVEFSFFLECSKRSWAGAVNESFSKKCIDFSGNKIVAKKSLSYLTHFFPMLHSLETWENVLMFSWLWKYNIENKQFK